MFGRAVAFIALHTFAKGIIRQHTRQAAVIIELAYPVLCDHRCGDGVLPDSYTGAKHEEE
jgi:hypothetical protein